MEQLFKRFLDLSKHTNIAQKSDSRLKTVIRRWDEDLIFKTKLKDETEWEREYDLEVFWKTEFQEGFRYKDINDHE